MLTNSHRIRSTFFDSFMFAYFLSVAMLTLSSAPASQELLELSRNLILFSGSLILGAVLSLFLNSKVGLTLGGQIFKDPKMMDQGDEPSFLGSIWGWQVLAFFIITFTVGAHVTKFSLTELLDEDGFAGAVRLFKGLADPNWALLPKAVANIIETIFMAFMATAMAIPIAFVMCFFCAKNIMTHPAAFVLYMLLRTLLNVMRSIEALVWAIIFSVWVGIGPFAGMLALMIHSIASLAKQYSEIVETVNEGPIEGIKSTGAGRLQVIWYAIVPQVILPFISFTIYRWDINIRMATIIGLVGGGGIGTMLILYQGQAMWREVGTIIFVIAFVVWFMDTTSAYIREALK